MKIMQFSNALFLFISIFIFAFDVQAFDASMHFEKKCSSCHSIGGGDDVGPDLKDLSKRRDKGWTARFIRESQAMIKAGDPVGNELFNKFKRKVMPDQELADADMDALLAFIDGSTGGATATKYRSALDANEYDIKLGEQLFIGNVRLKNGAPSCISCHAAGNAGILGGGALGPNLTHAFANYGDNGTSKVLTNIAFPSMQEIYKDKPLTEEEVFFLKSFMFNEDRKGDIDTGSTKKFFFLGFVGSVLSIGFFDIVFRNRRKKSRRPLN